MYTYIFIYVMPNFFPLRTFSWYFQIFKFFIKILLPILLCFPCDENYDQFSLFYYPIINPVENVIKNVDTVVKVSMQKLCIDIPFHLKKIHVYLFSCTKSQLEHVGYTSLTKDPTQAPYIGSWSLSSCTTREIPLFHF